MAERIEQRRAKGHDETFVDIMFWCRSGHHRSVAMVEMLASVLEEARALARSPLRLNLARRPWFSACVVNRSLAQPLASRIVMFACLLCLLCSLCPFARLFLLYLLR